MARAVFYIGGDSYPADQTFEIALRAALDDRAYDFIGHRDVLQGDDNPPFSAKLDQLEAAIKRRDLQDEIFIVGRSSGGRVATCLAGRYIGITAIVCFCYPFRAPDTVLETERFVHLASLETPTLILQGVDDAYGGLELTENYPLSGAIRLRFFLGGHETYTKTAAAPAILRKILDFIDGDWQDRDGNLDGFEEAFYRDTYPDIARAIDEGRLESGRLHFDRHGRREGRKYRMTVSVVR
jgi:pimeloyl-ACP methyl ester carboxylesterase